MTPRRRGVTVLAAGLVVGLGLALAPAQAAPAELSAPGISGGTSALGSPVVVALAVRDGAMWLRCSAALIRPRVLVTAAHCLTRQGSNEKVNRVRVFPPGVRARVFAVSGPRRPSPVRVVAWWRAGDYVNRDLRVQANDVAVILLASDLGPTAFVRIANQAELAGWAAAKSPVSHVGYGLTGPGPSDGVPYAVALPLTSVSMASTLGATFTTGVTATQGICSGDSGSPAFLSLASGAVLVGTMAGATGACTASAPSAASDLGFVTSGYLDLLNLALARGGYLTIPSAPAPVSMAARNRQITVSWDTPAVSPQTVVAYDVSDPAGTLVCQTDQLSCIVPSLPDGAYTYSVRARNAEGEGDALAAGMPVSVASPPAPSAPYAQVLPDRRIRLSIPTIAGRTSAVVTSYVVRDQAGNVVCQVVPPTADAIVLTCTPTLRRGTYQVSSHAETEMGPSPESVLSARFVAR